MGEQIKKNEQKFSNSKLHEKEILFKNKIQSKEESHQIRNPPG